VHWCSWLMLLLSPNLIGGQRDVTCEIMYPNWCPCLLCNFQTILGKHYSYTNQGVEINEKKFWRGPKKTGAAAVCAILHRMWRTFLCMEIPLTRGNLRGKNPGAAPQKTGADKEKLHTKTKAHCTSASLSRGGCQMPGESEHCTPSW